MRKLHVNRAAYLSQEQRIAPRSDIYCRQPFITPDGRQEVGTVINISADGLLMRYERPFEVGDMLIFKLPIIGRTVGRVVWSIAGKVGTQFDHMIPVEDYLPMVRAMGGRLRNN